MSNFELSYFFSIFAEETKEDKEIKEILEGIGKYNDLTHFHEKDLNGLFYENSTIFLSIDIDTLNYTFFKEEWKLMKILNLFITWLFDNKLEIKPVREMLEEYSRITIQGT